MVSTKKVRKDLPKFALPERAYEAIPLSWVWVRGLIFVMRNLLFEHFKLLKNQVLIQIFLSIILAVF